MMESNDELQITPQQIFDYYKATGIMITNNFDGDSGDYEYLYEAVQLSANVEGACIEIGLRLGKGTATIIDAIADLCPDKTAIAVDPYGHIPYIGREHDGAVRLDYTNTMRNKCLGDMYPYSESKGVRFKFIELTDTDFFDKYSDGVICYDLERYLVNKYSMVHLDGPHTIADVCAELDFFLPRMDIGAVVAFDDITLDFYDHSKVEGYFAGKLEIIKTGNKKQLCRKIVKGELC